MDRHFYAQQRESANEKRLKKTWKGSVKIDRMKEKIERKKIVSYYISNSNFSNNKTLNFNANIDEKES